MSTDALHDPRYIEKLTARGLAHAAAFRLHEVEIAASYEVARAREPGLRCAEWERRNLFIPSLDVNECQ